MKYFLYMLLLICAASLSAQDSQPVELIPGIVDVSEKTGKFLPQDIMYSNESGDSVLLAKLLDKPAIMNLVYYRCPGICSPLLSGTVKVIEEISLTPGEDFKALTLSFDERETPDLAKAKKAGYYQTMNREFPEAEWHWLTGNNANIKKLTRAIGFHYHPAGKDFAHPPLLLVLSPTGKIIRYFVDTRFSPFELKMALIDAAEGKGLSLTSRLLDFCYDYDADEKVSRLNTTRIGSSTLLVLLMMIGGFVVTHNRRRKD